MKDTRDRLCAVCESAPGQVAALVPNAVTGESEEREVCPRCSEYECGPVEHYPACVMCGEHDAESVVHDRPGGGGMLLCADCADLDISDAEARRG